MAKRTPKTPKSGAPIGIQVDPSGGMSLDVRGRAAPGLCLENLGQRCVRVVRGNERVLWARVKPYWEGLWFVRRSVVTPAGIVPPITAQEARSITAMSDWMKWFARGLEASSQSPLHDGLWQLTELRWGKLSLSDASRGVARDMFRPVGHGALPSTAYSLRGALSIPVAHYETWMLNGSGGVMPLRQPSDVEAARVKAWRKHARDGTLPPVLLWWVSAFDVYVLIDGHDRLVAAEAEGVQPRAVALWAAEELEIDEQADWRTHAVRRYEKSLARLKQPSREATRQANDDLIRAFATREIRLSRARFVADAVDSWLRDVAQELEAQPGMLTKLGVIHDEVGLRFADD